MKIKLEIKQTARFSMNLIQIAKFVMMVVISRNFINLIVATSIVIGMDQPVLRFRTSQILTYKMQKFYFSISMVKLLILNAKILIINTTIKNA